MKKKQFHFYVPNQAMEEKDGKVGIQKKMLADKLQELNDKEGYVISKPSRVTDKGVGFMVNIDYVDIEKDRGRVIWFPKSQVKEKDGDYFIPKWLYKKKKEELYDEMGKYEGARPGGLGYINTRYGSAKVEWEYKFEHIPVKLK